MAASTGKKPGTTSGTKADGKAEKKAAEKAEKKAAEKQAAKAEKVAAAKAEKKADAKKAEKKAEKKADKKKAEKKAEKRFLDQAIAHDTALARTARARAKEELVKERALVTRRLLKAKKLAEKIAADDSRRAAGAGAKTGGRQRSGDEEVAVPKRAPANRQRTARQPRTGTSAVRASAEPSASWTMVALRGYAAATGVSGYSRLNKADLLARLHGTDSAQ
jgi:hypothetical protein